MEALSPSLTAGERSELVRLRRDFHRFPELGFQERRTAGIIAEFLRGLGLAPSTGVAETGVVTLINPDAEGPTLLLRAVGGLPVQRPQGSVRFGQLWVRSTVAPVIEDHGEPHRFV